MWIMAPNIFLWHTSLVFMFLFKNHVYYGSKIIFLWRMKTLFPSLKQPCISFQQETFMKMFLCQNHVYYGSKIIFLWRLKTLFPSLKQLAVISNKKLLWRCSYDRIMCIYLQTSSYGVLVTYEDVRIMCIELETSVATCKPYFTH